MENICIVVVTYNRSTLLLENIDSIISYAKNVQEVIIINNNSSDETLNLVVEKYNLQKIKEEGVSEYSSLVNNLRISLLDYKSNTGGAGGFYRGVNYAYHKGYDWIWMMDDDVEVLENGLDTMLQYRKVSQCILAGRENVDGSFFKFDNLVNTKTGRFVKNIKTNLTDEYEVLNFGCFEGMLISKKLVSKIGFPDTDFFIVGDDTIYGLLASMHTNVIHVNKPILKRKLANIIIKKKYGFSWVSQSDLTLFYDTRNEFLKNEYYKKYFGSNIMILAFFSALRISKKLIIAIFFERSINQFKIITRGVISGVLTKKHFFKKK